VGLPEPGSNPLIEDTKIEDAEKVEYTFILFPKMVLPTKVEYATVDTIKVDVMIS
jgi:hypothetical protein